jgi:hypothetical protein
MGKKLLVLALAAAVAGGAFALEIPEIEFSAGGGILLDAGRIGGVRDEATFPEPYQAMSWDYPWATNHIGFGAFGFVDATFAELSVGFHFGSVSHTGGGGENGGGSMSGTFTALDLTLLGRFPFHIADGLAAFPLLGVGYNIVLSSNISNGETYSWENPGEFGTFRIHLGGGVDFDLTDKLFIRGSLLGSYRFAPTVMRNDADEARRDAQAAIAGIEGASYNVNARGGFGVKVRIGVGFRF